MSKSNADPFKPGSPLEQALHFLSDAMVSSHGRPEASTRLRAEAEFVEADRGGFDVSRLAGRLVGPLARAQASHSVLPWIRVFATTSTTRASYPVALLADREIHRIEAIFAAVTMCLS